MAGKPVEFHEQAATEYEVAVAWYYEQSPLAASKFDEELNLAIETIRAAPHRWKAYVHGTRKFLLWHFPFYVVYRELEDVILVLAVAHSRRRPGYWKTRF